MQKVLLALIHAPKTLQLEFSFVRSLLIVPVILTVWLVGGELMAESNIIKAGLPPEHYGSIYPPFEDQMHELDDFIEAHGSAPDCFILGSSMTQSGVNPQFFEAGYEARSGQDITCFNFSTWGLSASTAGAYAEILVDRYHPRLLLYGTAARDFLLDNQNAFLTGENQFGQVPWVRYHQGKTDVRGYLTEHMRLFRYFNGFHDELYPVAQDSSTTVPTRSQQGYQPELEVSAAVQQPVSMNLAVDAYTAALLLHYTPSPSDVEGLRQVAALNSETTRVLIYEAPVQPFYIDLFEHGDADYQIFVDTVTQVAHEYGVPFWATTRLNLIPVDQWKDRTHLYIAASVYFSEWLGQQVGEAVSRDSFADDTLPLQNPDIHPYYLDTGGFSPRDYAIYRQYIQTSDLLQGAFAFNPGHDPQERGGLLQRLGFYLDWATGVTESKRQAVFDFYQVLENMRYESDLHLNPAEQTALDNWRLTKDPRSLHDAHISYVIASDQWASWLGEAEAAMMDNPDNYEIVARWRHEINHMSYTLYRVR